MYITSMALHINNERADALARELASRTGETITEAVTQAIEARLREIKPRKRTPEEKYRDVMKIVKHISRLPVLDNRSAEEILGYDEHGLPT
jgi:antitoxin VapB